MNDYRARLRAAGLRPVQLWLPDTRSASFAKKVRKHVLRMAISGMREFNNFVCKSIKIQIGDQPYVPEQHVFALMADYSLISGALSQSEQNNSTTELVDQAGPLPSQG